MFSRRDFLKLASMGAGAALVNGCAPRLAPTEPGAAFPTLAPVVRTPARTSTPRIVSPTPAPTGTPLPVQMPGLSVSYAGRKLCFVLWDHQLAEYGYHSRDLYNPIPMTCPLASADINPMTPGWIAYWKGILHLCNPGMGDVHFEHAWHSLTASDRAFTNGTGLDSSNFSLHTLTCGGATHEMVSGEPDGIYMRIYTLDWNAGRPAIPVRPELIDMTRHFFATTGSNVKLADGSYAVYGFPQFENCIVPLVSQRPTDCILTARIKTVEGLQSPYNL